jgi:predicted aspartyl protease
MNQRYSTRYFPPAPVLEVSLISTQTGERIGPITALVDTGTDVTAVPMSLVQALQAPLARQAFVEAHWGERMRVSLFTLDMRIDTWIVPGLDVIGDNRGQEVIVGRDVLNKLWLELDGPAQKIEVAARRPRRK